MHSLPPAKERATLWVLAAIQFTHILDFMIMMPLGSQLMRVLSITPSQFSKLVAVYGIAASVTGLISGSVLDRFDRKKALIVLYTGFTLSTFACAFAPGFWMLLLARLAAGAFGGVAASVVVSMIGDVIPPARRGKAMSVVMTAFPLASVLGIPFALWLTAHGSWHSPFILLGSLGAIITAIAWSVLPSIKPSHPPVHPVRQMINLLSNPVHQRALCMSAALVLAGNLIIPFLAPSMVANVGVDEDHLFYIYLAGGLATLITTPIIGRFSDKYDKLRLITWVSLGCIAVVLGITRLPHAGLWPAMIMTALFMVFMSGRFSPAMAIVSIAVEPKYRAGFMSVNSAVQQAAGGAANLIAGVFVVAAADGHLVGYPLLGWLSAAMMILTVFLAYRLVAIAPHASRPSHHHIPPSTTEAQVPHEA